MEDRTRDTTVVGVFDSETDAENCVRELRDIGFRAGDISLVTKDRRARAAGRRLRGRGERRAAEGTSIAENVAGGALFGGLGGLLISLAAIAIPGVGPIVAAGPLATTLAGAGIGAVGGGIIGAIRNAGVPEDEANVYAESIRRGATLVAVHCGVETCGRAREIMNRHHAVDIDERARHYRENGWRRFDESAGEYETETTSRTAETRNNVTTPSSGGARIYPR
jgi:hypothetical protein